MQSILKGLMDIFRYMGELFTGKPITYRDPYLFTVNDAAHINTIYTKIVTLDPDKCPIGLDASPTRCSFGTCVKCRELIRLEGEGGPAHD
jgi:hypothetical protein